MTARAEREELKEVRSDRMFAAAPVSKGIIPPTLDEV
jgi:hypothetical protein